ncbi:hypothetical protein [Sporolactobacillus terrae]|uniref:hypothetical protein n=1 Tax=Sporolactobacillus terrae TaxID=269673 RepID=UPI001268DFD4|nr:hypothetical protein [Sporolactobacillus terrae]
MARRLSLLPGEICIIGVANKKDKKSYSDKLRSDVRLNDAEVSRGHSSYLGSEGPNNNNSH